MKSALNRQAISKIDRVDLEEKYLTLYDENIVLKKYGRKRDEEIKRFEILNLPRNAKKYLRRCEYVS